MTFNKIVWFGDSWVSGAELEEFCQVTNEPSYELCREKNRFANLVSKHFKCKEINFAIEGTSSEAISQQIVKYVNSMSTVDKQEQLIIITWPGITRYFWINEDSTPVDIRIIDKNNEWWYKTVHNYFYMIYVVQRSIMLTYGFLNSVGVKYFMINCDQSPHYVTTDYLYYPIDQATWLTNSQDTMANWINLDLNKGWPTKSEKHKYVWPCNNHPNLEGHKQIAKTIIHQLEGDYNESNRMEQG